MNVAVIPARGGSKRIPRKNIKDFCGKPIIFWPIEIAKKSELFDHILVSTDDKEIAKIAKDYGANVPFIRPKELADDFAERFRKKEKDQETLNKARQQTDALKYQQRMNDGYYKDNPDAFFADWEASNGNQYARELFAGSLGFKSQYINAETLSSTIVQAYKSGDMRLVYSAWASLPDEQQKIGFIYDDLNGLAQSQGVQFEDLDDHIKKITDATIDEVEKDGVLDKAAGPSASTMADYMSSELLSRYAADRNGTHSERYSRAKESIDKQLGYVNGVLVNFDSDGFRGSGIFKQKQGKSGATIELYLHDFLVKTLVIYLVLK